MRLRERQGGVSLIELMVGLVIGLVALLVIGQTMAVFEGEKRTTTGGADAQTNGYAALLTMERDIRMAGTGMVDPRGYLYCAGQTFRQYNGASEPAGSSPPNRFLPPIRIVNGVGDGSDAIVLVRSTATYGGAIPSTLKQNWDTTAAGVNSNCVSKGSAQPPSTLDPDTGKGDLFIVAPLTPVVSDLSAPPNPDTHPCFLVQASDHAFAGDPLCPDSPPVKYLKLVTAAGAAYPYNVAAGIGTMPGATATPTSGDLVISLGSRPYLRYGIDQGRLMQAEQLKYVQGGSTYVDDDRLMDDIVFIAAQYGIDTDCASTSLGGCVSSAGAAGNQSVDRFVEPAGVWAETALTPARFGRIKAIRLAVVARNSQYIKNDATCSENPVTVSPMDLWTKINAGDDPPPQFTLPVGGDGCQHYRYRVFETVVPLRNMIWGQL